MNRLPAQTLALLNGPRRSGFTLIELMIVVALIAILAVIAVPSYEQYVIRSNRAAAQTEMMDIANRQHQFFIANRGYAADLVTLGYTLPSDLGTAYVPTLAADNTATPPVFTVTFTGQGRQAKDGNLTLNSRGEKAPAGKW